jgi:hypothetical protein
MTQMHKNQKIRKVLIIEGFTETKPNLFLKQYRHHAKPLDVWVDFRGEVKEPSLYAYSGEKHIPIAHISYLRSVQTQSRTH